MFCEKTNLSLGEDAVGHYREVGLELQLAAAFLGELDRPDKKRPSWPSARPARGKDRQHPHTSLCSVVGDETDGCLRNWPGHVAGPVTATNVAVGAGKLAGGGQGERDLNRTHTVHAGTGYRALAGVTGPLRAPLGAGSFRSGNAFVDRCVWPQKKPRQPRPGQLEDLASKWREQEVCVVVDDCISLRTDTDPVAPPIRAERRGDSSTNVDGAAAVANGGADASTLILSPAMSIERVRYGIRRILSKG